VSTATVIEIADAVVDELNLSSVQETLGRTFEAKRSYIPEVKLEDAEKGLHVLVVPTSMPTGNLSRNTSLKEPVVQVGFLTRVPSDDTFEWLDELVLMMEAVGDYFRRKLLELSGFNARCVHADIPLIYDYDALREDKVFRSFVVLSFRRED
jgi:hypothetical protein